MKKENAATTTTATVTCHSGMGSSYVNNLS